MRRDRLAEGILALVAPADRAASAVGDLMEDAPARGRIWFWRSVARIGLSLLGRDLRFAPLAMAVSSAIAWFLYMGLSAVLALLGYVVVTLLWGVLYVLATHTGLELAADVLRLRFDWPPIPAGATYLVQAVVFFALAPFHLGRAGAPCWRAHELSLVLVLLPMWVAMAVLVPFVGVGIRATPAMMPVVAGFVLLGLLSHRFRPTPASS